ncbi:uncharacterized protein LOC113799450 [Dermatophagoides pteronyssinus]|uniref:uncharacterized protein LOC113799450 n=1 Tax=Dermatophagoides pteronyssinus TaxID=6956 RepID=UPI003F678085
MLLYSNISQTNEHEMLYKYFFLSLTLALLAINAEPTESTAETTTESSNHLFIEKIENALNRAKNLLNSQDINPHIAKKIKDLIEEIEQYEEKYLKSHDNESIKTHINAKIKELMKNLNKYPLPSSSKPKTTLTESTTTKKLTESTTTTKEPTNSTTTTKKTTESTAETTTESSNHLFIEKIENALNRAKNLLNSQDIDPNIAKKIKDLIEEIEQFKEKYLKSFDNESIKKHINTKIKELMKILNKYSLPTSSKPKTTTTEKPTKSTSTSTEKPTKPTSATTEKPTKPTSTTTKEPTKSTSTSTEKPTKSTSTTTEKPIKPTSTEKPTKSTNATTEKPTEPTSTTTEKPKPILNECPEYNEIGQCNCYPESKTIICTDFNQTFITNSYNFSTFIIQDNKEVELKWPDNVYIRVKNLIIHRCNFKKIDPQILNINGLKTLTINDIPQLYLNISMINTELSKLIIINISRIEQINALEKLNSLQELMIKSMTGFQAISQSESLSFPLIRYVTIIDTDVKENFKLKVGKDCQEIIIEKNNQLKWLDITDLKTKNNMTITIKLSDNRNLNPKFLLDFSNIFNQSRLADQNLTMTIRMNHVPVYCDDCRLYKLTATNSRLRLLDVFCKNENEYLKYLKFKCER